MIHIDKVIEEKIITKHGVYPKEVRECFLNRHPDSDYLTDDREDNRTDPETLWFLARTNCNRLLKVCFIYYEDRGTSILKTAYPPNADEVKIFADEFGLSEAEM